MTTERFKIIYHTLEYEQYLWRMTHHTLKYDK